MLACINPASPSLASRRGWALEGPVSNCLVRLGEWIRVRSRFVAIASALCVALAGLAALRLQVDQSMLSAFDEDQEIAEADRVINQLFDGTYFLDILLESKEPGGICDPRTL